MVSQCFPWKCSRIPDAGERGRLDRSGWRPAKHGFSTLPEYERLTNRLMVGTVRWDAGCETHPAATGTVALPRHTENFEEA
ncbi:MAG TPA: hypothetical protein VHZ30_07325 [Verrucomicrobiae bacterium]|nr:hypothetical protein [Verrucomicrobiae bacterium]